MPSVSRSVRGAPQRVVHDFLHAEIKKGALFLSEKCDVSFLPTPQNRHKRDPDTYIGPGCHDLRWEGRTVLIGRTGDHPAEWLHEVAHLVCNPPWEYSPEASLEFGGIFAWERAAARELFRLGYWDRSDLVKSRELQNVYGLEAIPETHPEDQFEGGTPSETVWEDFPTWFRVAAMFSMRKTLRMCNLLDGYNRPTWRKAVWCDEVHTRWWATRDTRSFLYLMHQDLPRAKLGGFLP